MSTFNGFDLSEAIQTLLQRSVSRVPNEILNELNGLIERYKRRNNIRVLSQLELMLSNLEYAASTNLPNCQDTGIPTFFIKAGIHSPYLSCLESEIKNAIIICTQKGILRPNSVDPLNEENPGDNMGQNTPPIYYELVESDSITITVLNKGGGAENYSALFMLNPSSGLKQLEEKILNRIKEAGGKPCPPIIIGLGIGGDAVKCMYLAKKALLRPVGSHHKRKDIIEIESRLFEKVNQLNVGVMGLGGPGTCLAVHCEYAMRHPASYPVGMIVQCYSHRVQSLHIDRKGNVRFGHLDAEFNFIKEE